MKRKFINTFQTPISIKKLSQVKKIFLIVNKKKRNKELKKINSSEILKLLKKNLEILIIE